MLSVEQRQALVRALEAVIGATEAHAVQRGRLAESGGYAGILGTYVRQETAVREFYQALNAATNWQQNEPAT